MKILFVCDYFPPFTPGGAEWSSFYLAKALAKNKNVQLTVLTPNYGHLPFKEEKDGFKLIHFPFIFKLAPGQKKLGYLAQNNFIYYLYVLFWILFVSLKEKSDVIHLQSNFSLISLGLTKLFLKKSLVFTFRDTFLFCPTGVCLQNKKILKSYTTFSHFWRNCRPLYIKFYLKPQNFLKSIYAQISLIYLWFDLLIKRQALKIIDHHIFISSALKKLYLKAGLTQEAKARVVYNLPPVGVKPIGQKKLVQLRQKLKLKNKKIVLFAGRLTLGKGIFDLIKAADLIYQKNKKIIFLLVGKGRIKKKLSDNVKIIGSVTHPKLFDFYQLADLIVVPSKGFEPLGRIPQEAGLFGKPIVVTQSGGLVEQVIDKKTGLIVSRGDSFCLSAAILKLIKNPDLSNKMGQEQLKYIQQKFNPKKIIKHLLFIYQDILQ